jgi:hypothetical protein
MLMAGRPVSGHSTFIVSTIILSVVLSLSPGNAVSELLGSPRADFGVPFVNESLDLPESALVFPVLLKIVRKTSRQSAPVTRP